MLNFLCLKGKVEKLKCWTIEKVEKVENLKKLKSQKIENVEMLTIYSTILYCIKKFPRLSETIQNFARPPRRRLVYEILCLRLGRANFEFLHEKYFIFCSPDWKLKLENTKSNKQRHIAYHIQFFNFSSEECKLKIENWKKNK